MVAQLVLATVFKTVEPYVKHAVGGFDSHALPPFFTRRHHWTACLAGSACSRIAFTNTLFVPVVSLRLWRSFGAVYPLALAFALSIFRSPVGHRLDRQIVRLKRDVVLRVFIDRLLLIPTTSGWAGVCTSSSRLSL